MLTVNLRSCSELAWWLVTSFFFFFSSPSHCLWLGWGTRVSRRCAITSTITSTITSMPVAKEMWSDSDGWRRVCWLKLRRSWVGQGGAPSCLIDYLIRLNSIFISQAESLSCVNKQRALSEWSLLLGNIYVGAYGGKKKTRLFNKCNWTMTDMAKGTHLIYINFEKPSNSFIQGIDGHFT